jgi:two-component system, NtrC family, response regulator
MSNILVVEDDQELCNILAAGLTETGHRVTAAMDGADALKKLQEDSFDLLITDLRLPGMDGIEILKESKEKSPSTIVILMTGYGTIDNAVKAMRMGAIDYIVKPFSIQEVEIRIARALEGQRFHMEHELLRELVRSRFGPMIGTCEKMQHLYGLIEKVAATSVPVLITGESGTGKELVAREIHHRSERKNGPFIVVNCVTLASGILESELFGHERGSFTGAVGRRKGKFEIAHGGTLFLDEIGELIDTTQVKLLRFLQEKEFQRVGGNDNIRVDVQVIAATNRDLQQRMAEGLFREDLFYRLNTFSIPLPPLKERGDDLYKLIDHFIAKFNVEFRKNVTPSPEVLDILKQHRWPGNIRELENVIAQAVILAEGNTLELSHLPYALVKSAGELAIQEDVPEEKNRNLGSRVEAMEARVIALALEKTGGNQTRTAKALGMKRSSLQYKIKKYGLAPPKTKNEE